MTNSRLPSQSSASTVQHPTKNNHIPPPPRQKNFNLETIQQRLQQLIDGARESWTYAIFWEFFSDDMGASMLGWGDGYYNGEGEEGKSKMKGRTAAEQEHRKKVLRELNSLISGSTVTADDAVDEEVTDMEWFFLISMTQSFSVNKGGLSGQAFFSNSPVWVSGPEQLASSSCDRARQGQVFGLQTMVCIPSANGVVELGSTEIIVQSSDVMNKNEDQGENDPSSWINDPIPCFVEIKDSATAVASNM